MCGMNIGMRYGGGNAPHKGDCVNGTMKGMNGKGEEMSGTRVRRERERSLVVFSTPLRPGGLILRHRYHTLLGFGSCEITVGNQSLFDNFVSLLGAPVRFEPVTFAISVRRRYRYATRTPHISRSGEKLRKGWPTDSREPPREYFAPEKKRNLLLVLLLVLIFWSLFLKYKGKIHKSTEVTPHPPPTTRLQRYGVRQKRFTHLG